MKKNNKFRNNGGSTNAYSLNYKFDSISPAGKISGTALDLIKKYNELAKEAHGSGDYIEMEIYRQYAEHYRKIVTEINERRAVRIENSQSVDENASPETESASVQPAENVSEQPAEQPAEQSAETAAPRKAFKVIEIQPQTGAEKPEIAAADAKPIKPRRIIRRVKKSEEISESAAAI